MSKNKNEIVCIDDYKDEIDKYIKERVEKEAASESVKMLKSELKKSKAANSFKNLLILFMIAAVGYGVFYLYQDGYFDKDKNTCKVVDKEKSDKNADSDKDKTKKVNKPTLDDLSKKYSHLLDNIKIDTNSSYLEDYYKGNLTNSLKLSLAYNLIDEKDIEKDDETIYFDSYLLSDAYNKLFNDNIKYETFNVNGTTLKYLENKEMYMGTKKVSSGNEIIREIIDINVEEDYVLITTIEGYLDNNKLYNINTNKVVSSYKDGMSLSKYEEKLNKVEYLFENECLKEIK